MPLDRRSLIAGTGAAALAIPARAAPLSHYGLDAAPFGLRPGAPEDQSARLQRAIDEAARTRVPLAHRVCIAPAGSRYPPECKFSACAAQRASHSAAARR